MEPGKPRPEARPSEPRISANRRQAALLQRARLFCRKSLCGPSTFPGMGPFSRSGAWGGAGVAVMPLHAGLTQNHWSGLDHYLHPVKRTRRRYRPFRDSAMPTRLLGMAAACQFFKSANLDGRHASERLPAMRVASPADNATERSRERWSDLRGVMAAGFSAPSGGDDPSPGSHLARLAPVRSHWGNATSDALRTASTWTRAIPLFARGSRDGLVRSRPARRWTPPAWPCDSRRGAP